ncbi:MAG: hypothetical protein Q4B10_00415 [Actinomycetaceae bacterium]|nr:hypothetical protein [Actinomycetaceae bacterium]
MKAPDVVLALDGDLEVDVVRLLAGVATIARRCLDLTEALGAAAAGIGTVVVCERASGADPHAVAELHRLGVRVIVADDEPRAWPGAQVVAREPAAIVAAIMTPTEQTRRDGGEAPAPDAGRDISALSGAELAALLPPDPFVEENKPPQPSHKRRYPARAARRNSGPVEPRVDGKEHGGIDASASRKTPARGTSRGDEADTGDNGSTERDRRGRILAVVGPPGAPGRTTTAVAVAATLARANLRVLLVDADTAAPSIVYHLGLPDESSGIAAACHEAAHGALTPLALADLVVETPWAFDVVTGLDHPSRWRELSRAGIEAFCEVARGVYDVVVVDTAPALNDDEEAMFFGPSRDEVEETIRECSDDVVAVGAADPVGMRRLVGYLNAQKRTEEIRVVVTRVDAAGAGPGAHRAVKHVLARYCGVETCQLVSRDPLEAARALLEARPLDPASPPGRDIEQLCRAWSPHPPAPPRRTWRDRLKWGHARLHSTDPQRR